MEKIKEQYELLKQHLANKDRLLHWDICQDITHELIPQELIQNLASALDEYFKVSDDR